MLWLLKLFCSDVNSCVLGLADKWFLPRTHIRKNTHLWASDLSEAHFSDHMDHTYWSTGHFLDCTDHTLWSHGNTSVMSGVMWSNWSQTCSARFTTRKRRHPHLSFKRPSVALWPRRFWSMRAQLAHCHYIRSRDSYRHALLSILIA